MSPSHLDALTEAANDEVRYPVSAGRAAAAELDRSSKFDYTGWLFRVVLEAALIAVLITAGHWLLDFSGWRLLTSAFCAALVTHLLVELPYSYFRRQRW